MIVRKTPFEWSRNDFKDVTRLGLKKWLSVISILLITQGCSLFTTSAEKATESLKAGNAAFDAGNYSLAVAHFRDVSTESKLYPEAVRMIQKIPYQKGIAAFEQEQYRRAISEFFKVPRQAEEYEDAQQYIKIAEYKNIRIRYEEADEQEKLEMIPEMTEYAKKAGATKPMLESVDAIHDAMKRSKSTKQTRDLINILEGVVSDNKNLVVQEKALNNILSNFEQLYQQKELRAKIFEIIGMIKLNING